MDTASEEQSEQAPDGDLSLRDAAELYEVSVRTLAQRLRACEVAGYKTRGAAGREWRVPQQALEVAGYRRRPDSAHAGTGTDALDRLRQDLAVARRLAAAERRRADDLDRRLGHALLEAGRLRTALAAATGAPEATGAALEPDAARWLKAALTSGAALRRDARTSLPDVPRQIHV